MRRGISFIVYNNNFGTNFPIWYSDLPPDKKAKQMQTSIKTQKKLQSVGNSIASASFKPQHATGAALGPIPALGYIRAGEIVEFEAIRLYEAREGVLGREIVGSREAASWEPYEIIAESEKLRVRRSTTWEDRHVQWWEIRGDTAPQEIIVWCEFNFFAPGKITLENGQVWWETTEGNAVAIQVVGGDLRGIAAGRDAPRVRAQLEQGQTASEWKEIRIEPEWRKGVVGIRLRGAAEGRFIMAVGRKKAEIQEKLNRTLRKPEGVVDEMKEGWNVFFSSEVPKCPVADGDKQKLWKEAWYVLRANRFDYHTPPLSEPFGSPSKFNYTHQWLWDSAFHAIAWLRSNKPERAQEELTNLLENPQENGRISHEIVYSTWMNWGEGLRGKSHFVPTSQPPVLAMAVEKTYQRIGNLRWLERAWPALKGCLTWWGTVRDPDQDGLAGWASGWESGLDDSPRWDHIPRDHNTFFPAPVEAVELNALLVNEWRTMARLGRILGLAGESQACERKSRQIMATMREKLWDENEGFFFCLDHEEKPVRMKTIGGLLGLLALEKGDREVKVLVDQLQDEKLFWTRFPVPSVALNEKAFDRGQMWRGPTWINTNWLLIDALERLGESPLAQELRARTLNMTMVTGEPVLYEWYDPISGQGLGNMDYGWSTLVLDMLYSV